MQSPSYISTIINQLENAGFDQQLVFHFGEMNYDLLHRMVFSVEDALLALGDDKKVVKNVFSVVTEGLKNTLIHGEKINEKQDTLFLLATNKAKIKLVIGNYTNSKKQGEISDFIDQLNALEKDQIQKMVQQKLTEGLMEPTINSGIGMLTMRLKSSDQIHYSFTPVNDEVMFLAIQADFNRKQIREMSFPVAYAPIYVHPVPENHRFPMEKYSLLKEQLVYEGIISPTDLFEPTVIEQRHLVDVHTQAYIKRLINLDCTPREQRVSGFVHSSELIQRELIIMEGTRKCAELVVDGGIAFNIAGGTHHAYSDRGEGFCLLNDQAIASNFLLKNTAVKRILIIDLDVHQGNGTAQIFAHEKAVFTFSMHGQSNYPLQKEQSDLDVGLPDNCGDDYYLSELTKHLVAIQVQFVPDFIFYQCGVDVLAADKLGKLGLSLAGCAQRDELVFSFAQSLDCPIVCTMGGGYAPEIRTIIEAHTNTFRRAQKYF